eukprot:14558743-Alexandrium_andersonii.AAC.1
MAALHVPHMPDCGSTTTRTAVLSSQDVRGLSPQQLESLHREVSKVQSEIRPRPASAAICPNSQSALWKT